MTYKDTQTLYQVYWGVLNYTIYLNKDGKLKEVQDGNELPTFRDCFQKKDWNILNNALRFLFIAEPEKFKELYTTLKENDPEIFEYVNSVVESIEEYCKNLRS